MRMVLPPARTAAGLLLLGGLACEDDAVLNRLPRPPVQVDVLTQRPASLVDVLWVVDNSGSMVDEQDALAANFDRFIAGLTTCPNTGVANDICDFEQRRCLASGTPCNPPDYHIGVISTDVRSEFDTGRLRRVGLCTVRAGGAPANEKYRYCLNTDADCAHDPDDPSSDPANDVCDMSQATAFVTPRTLGRANAFSRAVRVGANPLVGRETGIEAAAFALGRATDRATGQFRPIPAENEGFLRPEASLFVIFVSDEDDFSFGQPTYFYRAFETVKGAGNEALVSMSAIVGDPDADGEDGPLPGGCEVPASRPGDPPVRNSAGTRYVALAMYTRGIASELRVCDGQRLSCPAGLGCQAPVADLPGICLPAGRCETNADCGSSICANGRPCVSCEAGRCEAEAEPFLELLERNGIFGSICAPDYGRVLSALGFEAAGLARRFSLSEVPSCALDPVPCCAADVPVEACTTTAPMCVLVQGQPVANDRATGWVYDAGGNAVFFDGANIPPPGAEVRISYRQTPAGGDNSTCARMLR